MCKAYENNVHRLELAEACTATSFKTTLIQVKYRDVHESRGRGAVASVDIKEAHSKVMKTQRLRVSGDYTPI